MIKIIPCACHCGCPNKIAHNPQDDSPADICCGPYVCNGCYRTSDEGHRARLDAKYPQRRDRQ